MIIENQLNEINNNNLNNQENITILNNKNIELNNIIDHNNHNFIQLNNEINQLNNKNNLLTIELTKIIDEKKEFEVIFNDKENKYKELYTQYEEKLVLSESLQLTLNNIHKEIMNSLFIMKQNNNANSSSSGSSNNNTNTTTNMTIDELIIELNKEINLYNTNSTTQQSQQLLQYNTINTQYNTINEENNKNKERIQELNNELKKKQYEIINIEKNKEIIQLSYKENENSLNSLKQINKELEYMCDTMAIELKNAMKKVEEFENSNNKHKNDYLINIENINKEYIIKINNIKNENDLMKKNEINLLQQQINELTLKLENNTNIENNIKNETLQYRTECMKLQQEQERVATQIRDLYTTITTTSGSSIGLTESPSKDTTSTTTTLLHSLNTIYTDWKRQVQDLQLNNSIQADTIAMKSNLVDDLTTRLQQQTVETQDCLLTISKQIEKMYQSLGGNIGSPTAGRNIGSPVAGQNIGSPTASRNIGSPTTGRNIGSPAASTGAYVSPIGSPVSPTNSSRKSMRKEIFSTTTGTTLAESSSVLYNKIIYILSRIPKHYDHALHQQTVEIEGLKEQLLLKEKEYEKTVFEIQSTTEIMKSNQQSEENLQSLQLQQQQLLQEIELKSNELIEMKNEFNQEKEQYIHEINEIKETYKIQSSQLLLQIKHGQKIFNKSIKERSLLQDGYNKLKNDNKKYEDIIGEMNDQMAASQLNYQKSEDKYLQQISLLEQQVDNLLLTNSEITTAAATTTINTTPMIHTNKNISSNNNNNNNSNNNTATTLFYFDNIILTHDQMRAKLYELMEYRNTTERKILDFEKLIMSTFYHRVEEDQQQQQYDIATTSTTATAGAANNTGSSSSDMMKPSYRILKSFSSTKEQHSQLELSEEEDSLNGNDGIFEPTTPIWRKERKDSDLTVTPSANLTNISPPGRFNLSTTASESLLGGMLQDFHHVLKEHRRLKRLCSSQQVCIMALR